MICKTAISYGRCQDLLDYLEAMRLPLESPKTEIVLTQDEEKKEDESSSSPIDWLNDPSIYSSQIPFLIYDENKETIISRTTKGINEGKLNPFEVDWAEVTLYETHFVRDLLEGIDSIFIMDVAQAIDDEDKRNAREDGQFTQIASDYYGTGQGSANFYSYMRDNWQNDSEYVSAGTIAEGILEKRKKAEVYRQKINKKTGGQTTELKRHIVEIIDNPESHLHINMKKSIIDQNLFEENNALKIECDEWKRKYEETISKEPEKAFSASGKECFTKAKMGLLIYTIASLTDGPTPIKNQLVSIISAIGGWEETSVNSEMKKAGFNQKDIDAVAKVFESAMPEFASEIRKQIPRRGKTKK
jgi:hypothetical protein